MASSRILRPTITATLQQARDEHSETSKPRQKRWAPKTKLGCLTCRKRRIKCDETKPYCKKCISTGRWCKGYDAPDSDQSDGAADLPQKDQNKHIELMKQSANTVIQYHGPNNIPAEPMPPDWDFIEGFRYFVRVMIPAYSKKRLAQSAYDNQFSITAKFSAKHSFLMIVTSNCISSVSRVRGALPRPDELPSLAYLWSRFHYHMLHAIQGVNMRINDGSPPRLVLYRVVDVLSVELAVIGKTWRAHIEGFAALVRMYGGATKLIALEGWFRPILAMQFVLVTAAMANTTSPAMNQITGLSDWTDADVKTIYSYTVCAELPCPTCLFLCINEITRLRVLAASGVSISNYIWPTALGIFDQISDFSPHDWTEPYSLPDTPEIFLMGSIFKSAVTLYGILSLPHPISPATFSCPRGSHAAAAHHHARITCRTRLLQQIVAVMDLLHSKKPLAWPLAVLGVSLVDGAQSDKLLVERYLQDMLKDFQLYAGPMISVVKLRKFWESGQVGWEDCWDEPCTVLG